MEHSVLDISGEKYGRLTALFRVGKDKFGKGMWACVCDCGTVKVVDISLLRRGSTLSCGCLDRENHSLKPNRKSHGMCGTRIYRIWKGMKSRCYNKNTPDYKKWYGAEGVTVCDEWRESFEPFYKWAMGNGYREDLSIDRIDPYGDYEPSNCRWADAKTQANNKRKKKVGD